MLQAVALPCPRLSAASLHKLRAALSEREVLLARWVETFIASDLRLPLSAQNPQALAFLARPMLEGLAEAFAPPRSGNGAVTAERDLAAVLRPGGPEVREVEKSAAFAGASMASTGATGFDVAAIVNSLRDVLLAAAETHRQPALHQQLWRLFEWLCIIAMDSYASAREHRAHERLREILEASTPVVLVTPTVPAALLLGAPDTMGFESILGRLLALVVRVGAPAAIIDAAGLRDHRAPGVLTALDHFAGHRKIAGAVTILASSVEPDVEPLWHQIASQHGTPFRCEENFLVAVLTALKQSQIRLAPDG